MVTEYKRQQQRGGPASAWTSANVVLLASEIGVETDTGQFKIGDGTTQWNSLPYAGGGGAPGGEGTVTSVNGNDPDAFGNVSIDKADVGLGNVNDTTDAAKPISTATATALGLKADLVAGVVPTDQLPAIAVGQTFSVASQAAMLALDADLGDIAIRTDLGSRFILSAADPTILANWTVLTEGGVISVAGKTGVVSLVKGDVGLGSVDNTTDAAKPISTATELALDSVDTELAEKAPMTHAHDSEYWRQNVATGFYDWFQGDADPSWAAGGRPAGLRAFITVDDAGSVPAWKQVRDKVFIRAVSTYPEVRGVGGFTAMTADAGTTTCAFPAEVVDGDECWLMVSTSSAATPTTPAGWSVLTSFLSSGASNTDGLIIYTKSGLTTDAGDAVTVTLGTSTSAVASIVAWKGDVSVNGNQTHVDDTNAASAQVSAAITPTAACVVLCVSALRYNALAGGTNVLTRTGWTEQFDRASNKAGAPQRGLLLTICDTYGANGVATASSSATTTNVVRTAEQTIAVVKV